jgi:hypothetical protein
MHALLELAEVLVSVFGYEIDVHFPGGFPALASFRRAVKLDWFIICNSVLATNRIMNRDVSWGTRVA